MPPPTFLIPNFLGNQTESKIEIENPKILTRIEAEKQFPGESKKGRRLQKGKQSRSSEPPGRKPKLKKI